jgi:4-amino-4-deoxy-L-arabinose transferase-like glycosyltransferase
MEAVRSTWRRRLPALVVLAYLLALLLGLRSIGLTDDDDFYIPAGIGYARWLGHALSFESGAWSRATIDAAFSVNKEHPPLAKYALGVCHFLFQGLLGPTDSARVATVLFSTLTAGLLMFLALAHLGPERGLRTGAFAVLALLLLPRFYFHSHAGTLDVPVTAMYLAAATAALRAERSRRASWIAGVVFGLAAATKLNAPFLLLAYLPYVLLTRVGRVSSRLGARPGLPLPAVPAALVSMALIGPLVFLASWPWLWKDTLARIGEYVGFHLHHYGILFLYLGRVYSEAPFAPWHAPFVMAASTMPLALLGLCAIGVVSAWPAVRARLRFKDGPDDDQRRAGDLWLFSGLNLFTTIGVVAFAGTPIYGGEKLFMPFFPFACLFAGYGATCLVERIERELGAASSSGQRWAGPIVVAGLAGSALALSARFGFGAYGLSEYNGLAGGLRGATATGFERQYYDVAFRDLVAWLDANAPPNTRLHFLPNNWEYVRTYRWYKEGGELRADLSVVNAEGDADWVVITHERRFARYGDDLRRYRGRPVLEERLVDGTPLWTVVKAR